LKPLAKATGAAEARSTQHYWALNIILLMLRATLVIILQKAAKSFATFDLSCSVRMLKLGSDDLVPPYGQVAAWQGYEIKGQEAPRVSANPALGIEACSWSGNGPIDA
jgi:hypothetical protein